MSAFDIARWRLVSQLAVAPHANGPVEVVQHLLAVQAENPRQSEWAVACRTTDPSAPAIAAALDSGALLRTHVLRPTWFYAAASDLGWLLDLTSARASHPMRTQLVNDHGIDGPTYERAAAIVTEQLTEQPDRLRDEVRAALDVAGLATAGLAMAHLLAQLEMDQVIVSGRPRDGQHTYATFASRVPSPRRLDRDDALAELARRYLAGHGPATDRDLAYWASLTVTDARRALDHVRDETARFEFEGRTFWHRPGDPPTGPFDPRAHLLQILDEMYRGYQDSRWLLDAAGVVPRQREQAIGMALIDGQLVAAMRRTVERGAVRFDLSPYRALATGETAQLQSAAERYGAFLGLPAEVVVSDD